MTDQKKVVRALECLSRNAQDGSCGGCAYFRPFTDDTDTGWCDRTSAMNDALVLLMDHEPVKPERITIWDGDFPVENMVCGACRVMIDEGDQYCRSCGRAVKRDD